VRRYLCGLVSGLDRKNGWTLVEQAGDVSPVVKTFRVQRQRDLVDLGQPALPLAHANPPTSI
jgi:hypothetical protein